VEKKKLGPGNFVYPLPTTIVGSLINGKPNYAAIAYCGVFQNRPPMLSVAIGRAKYTNLGIKENRTFSVNIPSEEMAEATDYLGLVSGRNVDKSALFETFYGTFNFEDTFTKNGESLSRKNEVWGEGLT